MVFDVGPLFLGGGRLGGGARGRMRVLKSVL